MTKSNNILSAYQVEILDSIARVKNEDELREIRDLIAEYFSNKALDEMDRLCNEGCLNTDTIQTWAYGHDRVSLR